PAALDLRQLAMTDLAAAPAPKSGLEGVVGPGAETAHEPRADVVGSHGAVEVADERELIPLTSWTVVARPSRQECASRACRSRPPPHPRHARARTPRAPCAHARAPPRRGGSRDRSRA